MEKSEKMKKFTVIGIVLSLFVGIVYTGVLNYYGKIVGTINVQGPIFYADLTENGATVGELLSNTKPQNTYTTTFRDGATISFRSDNLNGINFTYIPQCKFSIKINSSENSSVNLFCVYVDTSGKYHIICQTSLNTTNVPEVKTASCNGESILSSVKYILYEIKGDLEFGGSYTLETNTNGDTRLQLDKAT
jgi:hypothetical protein